MSQQLRICAGDRSVGLIEHDGVDDRWSLRYDPGWRADPQAYPLSPALPLTRADGEHPSASIRRFIEHLLPEGRALDVAVAHHALTRGNVFGLIRALGAETTGALRFSSDAGAEPTDVDDTLREIPLAELDARIAGREQSPLSVWDGKVRMSAAGLQDKLLVYCDRSPAEGGRLYLVEGRRLASTHILKPDPGRLRTPHLAANEHWCMQLARRIGLPSAEVLLLRTPRPVLVVRRFDRVIAETHERLRVQRLHLIDACQACDLPVSHKYERNLGSAPEVRHIRDGVSFQRVFDCTALAGNKAAARLRLLQWALFQFLIGNSDAHGKNLSFFVRPGGLLEPADWYDLVSVLPYDGLDGEWAMAYGDVFSNDEMTPFALADFATRCGIDRKLMRREGRRLARLAANAAFAQAAAPDYLAEERGFVAGLADLVRAQADRLTRLVDEAATIAPKFL